MTFSLSLLRKKIFFKISFYLKIRVAEIEGETEIFHQLSHMVKRASAGPVQSFIQVKHVDAEAPRHLCHLSLLPGTLADSWIGNGAARTQTNTNMEADSELTLCHSHSAKHKFLKKNIHYFERFSYRKGEGERPFVYWSTTQMATTFRQTGPEQSPVLPGTFHGDGRGPSSGTILAVPQVCYQGAGPEVEQLKQELLRVLDTSIVCRDLSY